MMIKLRVKDPIRTERGELAGSGNYGPYGAGDVFELSNEEARKELEICSHALEPYEEWEKRQVVEQLKNLYTRQQAEDLARHQAELKEMASADVSLRKQALEKRLSGTNTESSAKPDFEKEELRKRLESQERTIAELKALIEPLTKPAHPSLGSKKKQPDKGFTPEEER